MSQDLDPVDYFTAMHPLPAWHDVGPGLLGSQCEALVTLRHLGTVGTLSCLCSYWGIGGNRRPFHGESVSGEIIDSWLLQK